MSKIPSGATHQRKDKIKGTIVYYIQQDKDWGCWDSVNGLWTFSKNANKRVEKMLQDGIIQEIPAPAADMVNRPPHYNQYKHECQDFRDFMHGPISDAFKYVWRFQDKAKPIEDLNKAGWYTSRSQNYLPMHTISQEHLAMLMRMLDQIDFPYHQQRHLLRYMLKYGTGHGSPESRHVIESSIRDLIKTYESENG